jgi:hypothetical protein
MAPTSFGSCPLTTKNFTARGRDSNRRSLSVASSEAPAISIRTAGDKSGLNAEGGLPDNPHHSLWTSLLRQSGSPFHYLLNCDGFHKARTQGLVRNIVRCFFDDLKCMPLYQIDPRIGFGVLDPIGRSDLCTQLIKLARTIEISCPDNPSRYRACGPLPC